MKSKAILFIPLTVVLLLVYGFGGSAKWPGGSPGGYTGSPGDGKDCTNCHGGTSSQVLNWITSDIPDDGYIPGETYTISVTVDGNGDKGFEISPQDLQGNLLGTLIDGPDVHLVAGNKAVTQDDATSANPAQWEFEWIAPETGTGDVTFYGAFTVNKPVTKLSTYIATENTSIFIEEPADLQASVYPNPAKELINIVYHAEAMGKLKIDLVSMNGRSIILLNDAIVQKGDHSVTCLLPQGLQTGIYILRIQQNVSSSRIKLIVE